MSYPKNPETIVIQNEFYPKGLKEIDIWNYYQKVKNNIIKEVLGRELIFFFATDLNNIIVIRKGKNENKYINLNYANYDETISGRTISIHSTMGRFEDIGIIDIDIDNFGEAKEATIDVYNEMLKAPFIDSLYIKYTGKNSFHVVLKYKRVMKIDYVSDLLKEYLEKTQLANLYDIGFRRKKGVVNLDLSSNKYRGGFITLHSLSIIGLRSIIVNPKFIKSFNKNMAKII